jgi:Type IV secretion-system coupling protein DNA-binding domain
MMNALLNLFGGAVNTERESITLGGVPLPATLETLHHLFVGSTGTGKTTLVDEVLSVAIPRGDRCIIVDPNGHHLSHCYREGDVILNPFDARSPGWSLFNELRSDYDCDRLARNVVPNGEGHDAQWHFYAQTLLAEILRVLHLRGERETGALMQWGTMATSKELAALLANTPAAGLFDVDAARALASTRFILTAHLSAHKYMPPGAFSLRDWLASSQGNLFITWREDMQTALMPLVSCWVDILCNAMLSLTPDPERRVWLSLDELGALGRLNSLEAALTRGRKYGLCVVAGLQAMAQLERIYGHQSALVLRSCFRNLVVLSVAKSDPDTADMLSRALGEREIEREQPSRSDGPGGITKSVTLQRTTERIALAGEITSLPNLVGYLALAGDAGIERIRIMPRTRPIVTTAIAEVTSC